MLSFTILNLILRELLRTTEFKIVRIKNLGGFYKFESVA